MPRLYTDNVTNFVNDFCGCTALEEIDGLITNAATTLGEYLRFSGTGTSKKITFGARNKAKLSAAQLA